MCKLVAFKFCLFTSISIVCKNFGAQAASVHFSYSKSAEKWPESCHGYQQSPINIELANVKTMYTLTPFRQNFYDVPPIDMTIVNNGHSVQVTGNWPFGMIPYIEGGVLDSKYEVKQIHFHWDSETNDGSEHTLANHSFPLEMHIVHWKTDYGSFENALRERDGLAVVAYFLSYDQKLNAGIEMLMINFPDIKRPFDRKRIEPFALSLFDTDLSKEGYVTYQGSLTTPPCSENVIWIISVRIKDVTPRELNAFRQIELSNGDTSNKRPTQETNGRAISYVYDQLGARRS